MSCTALCPFDFTVLYCNSDRNNDSNTTAPCIVTIAAGSQLAPTSTVCQQLSFQMTPPSFILLTSWFQVPVLALSRARRNGFDRVASSRTPKRVSKPVACLSTRSSTPIYSDNRQSVLLSSTEVHTAFAFPFNTMLKNCKRNETPLAAPLSERAGSHHTSVQHRPAGRNVETGVKITDQRNWSLSD